MKEDDDGSQSLNVAWAHVNAEASTADNRSPPKTITLSKRARLHESSAGKAVHPFIQSVLPWSSFCPQPFSRHAMAPVGIKPLPPRCYGHASSEPSVRISGNGNHCIKQRDHELLICSKWPIYVAIGVELMMRALSPLCNQNQP